MKKIDLLLKYIREIEGRVQDYKDLIDQDTSPKQILRVLMGLKVLREQIDSLERFIKERERLGP